MAELRDQILSTLKAHYDEDPNAYTFVTSVLAEVGIPFDASMGEILVGLQKDGFIQIMQTTNIRIRLTSKGAESL